MPSSRSGKAHVPWMCLRMCPGDRYSLVMMPVSSLVAEVDEQAAEILGVLLHAMVERLDLLLLQEPEHPLLELPRALAWDDLDQRRLLPHGLVDDVPQRAVDVLAPVVDVMQVELELHLAGLRSAACPHGTRGARRARRGHPATHRRPVVTLSGAIAPAPRRGAADLPAGDPGCHPCTSLIRELPSPGPSHAPSQASGGGYRRRRAARGGLRRSGSRDPGRTDPERTDPGRHRAGRWRPAGHR